MAFKKVDANITFSTCHHTRTIKVQMVRAKSGILQSTPQSYIATYLLAKTLSGTQNIHITWVITGVERADNSALAICISLILYETISCMISLM